MSDPNPDNLRRKVILHIGTMKTGTSSIQAMLAQNRPWLARQDFAFVPGPQRTSEQISSRIAALTPGQNLIVSDEGLWHFAHSPRSDTARIAEVLRDFDVTVLAYLRRPDEFLESWFMQGLKFGTGNPSIATFRAHPFVRAGSNPLSRLSIFANLFGPKTIRLAAYERAQMAHGDATIDFLRRAGLAAPDDTHDSLAASGLVWPTERNVTPDADTMLLVSLLRQTGQCTEAELKQLMDTASLRKGSKTQIFRTRECENINARYRPLFAKTQALYGGGAEPDFFLDWEVSDAKQLCALRPIYDRMVAQSQVQNPKAPSDPTTALQAAFVIQKLTGLSGGAERVFIETAEAMAARGISTRLICLDADPSKSLAFGTGRLSVTSVLPDWIRQFILWRAAGRTKKPGGLSAAAMGQPVEKLPLTERLVKAIPNVFPLTRLKWRLSHGMFQRALKRDLQRTPADVIVAFLPPAITAASWAGKQLGIPVIASTHNLPELDFGTSDRWDQNPVYRARARKALAQVARVTVLQPEFLSWFSPAVLPHVTVLPNPVSRLCDLPDPPPQRENVILGVGRLTRIKRWDLLIDAFGLAAADLPGWSLRLFGTGPEQDALQARIAALQLEDRITILPPTPNIGAEYDRASLLVHPSEFEGFGLSVAEAMAHGLPVVAFADCPGVNTLIVHDHSGLLLPRPDTSPAAAQTLADALIDMSQDPEHRAHLGIEAAIITQRFDRQPIHDTWAELLRTVGVPTIPDKGKI